MLPVVTQFQNELQPCNSYTLLRIHRQSFEFACKRTKNAFEKDSKKTGI